MKKLLFICCILLMASCAEEEENTMSNPATGDMTLYVANFSIRVE